MGKLIRDSHRVLVLALAPTKGFSLVSLFDTRMLRNKRGPRVAGRDCSGQP